MHATYSFLMNYDDDVTLPELEEDLIVESWMMFEAIRLMMKSSRKDSTEISSENFEQTVKRFKEGLRERWENMSSDQQEEIRLAERQRARYLVIANELNDELGSEYFDTYGDENNWWQAEVAVFKNGQVAPLCEIDDWRGRGWVYYRYLMIEEDKRWEEAVRFGLSCVAYDFDIPGLSKFNLGEVTDTDRKINEMTAKELIDAINYYAPRYICKVLLEYITVVINSTRDMSKDSDVTIGDLINMIYPKDTNSNTEESSIDPTRALAIVNKTDKANASWMDDWRLKNALEVYQSWKDSRCVPFAYSPERPYYNYRSYDLRPWNNERENNFIGDNSAILLVDVHT